MLVEGDSAPEFELPGVDQGTQGEFSLTDATGDDGAVLLLFYPFDFSPVCTNELCAIRDAEWFQFTPDLSVWGVSGDSTYAHRAFMKQYDLDFPLLSDASGNAAEAFGVCYDEWEGHSSVPKRSVFLVDADRQVRYAWSTDQAYEKPDFVPVKAALDELADVDKSPVPDGVEFDVSYDEEPTYT